MQTAFVFRAWRGVADTTESVHPATVDRTMISQRPLFPDQELPSPDRGGEPSPAPVWLQRMSLIVLVLFCLYIGVIVAVLPWTPRYWDHNAWLVGHPAVHAVMRQGWMRGLLSGLGLLDIWIGVSEAIHYRDHRA